MRMKKATAFGLAALMAATMIPAVPAMAKGDDSEGSVYYLNFKPEQADQWSDLAKKYTDETGVPVTVVTAASGTYESTLKSEMAKDEVPTLFQVNGPVGLASWKDYCYDLKDSDVYKNVESDDFVLKDDSGAVDGIAYVIETYGIIYNKALLKKYCEMDGAVIKSADEINNFETLKKVADDIQAKKDDLGVDGAFTSAGFDSSSDWRFKTHLANLPIYYEYKEDGITSTDAIKGTYLDNFKNLFDLYITDSTCEPSLLSSKTIDDANAEFGLGEAVFYQNGTWAYDNIKDNEVADEDMGMLPIYIGVDGEIICDYLNPKKLLDDVRLLCRGKKEPIKEVYTIFNEETEDGRNMAEMSDLLSDAINSIIDVKEESDIDSLFSAGGTSALMSDVSGLDDFELICFLVVK